MSGVSNLIKATSSVIFGFLFLFSPDLIEKDQTHQGFLRHNLGLINLTFPEEVRPVLPDLPDLPPMKSLTEDAKDAIHTIQNGTTHAAKVIGNFLNDLWLNITTPPHKTISHHEVTHLKEEEPHLKEEEPHHEEEPLHKDPHLHKVYIERHHEVHEGGTREVIREVTHEIHHEEPPLHHHLHESNQKEPNIQEVHKESHHEVHEGGTREVIHEVIHETHNGSIHERHVETTHEIKIPKESVPGSAILESTPETEKETETETKPKLSKESSEKSEDSAENNNTPPLIDDKPSNLPNPSEPISIQ